MTAPASSLVVSQADGVTTLTLNRPELRNALDPALLEELEAAVIRLYTDEQTRVVVLRGAGEGFMAGGDIRHFDTVVKAGSPAPEFAVMLSRINHIVQILREIRQPVVAAVHGACAGFGISLALAADLIIAADTAKFTLAYDRLGLSPDGGASWHLVRTLGLKRAAELVLLGDTIAANTAERWGLVNRVVPEVELDATVQKIVARLKAGAPEAQANARRLLNFAGDLALGTQLEAEAESFVHLTVGADFAEGIAAFLGKRPPGFTGK